MCNNTEMFDLYDKAYHKLDKTMYRDSDVPYGMYRFVVHICIFNREGNMLIAKRHEKKKSYPNYWAFSAAGSVISGESSEEAIKRETLEELGVDIFSDALRPFITIHWDNGFHDIYIIEKNIATEELILQKEEVTCVKWASKEEIEDMVLNDIFMPYQEGLIDLLFAMKNKRGMTHG